MSSSDTYLERLPPDARQLGSASKGEAEIITSRRERNEIESECAPKLKGSALGRGGKKIGILLEDEVRMIVRDPLLYPSGAKKCQMRIIGKTEFDGVNGVAVLCVLEGRFVMREIFRHPTRSWELEIVRGRRETGQTPRDAVRAEVKQELGYLVRRIHALGSIKPETALMSSTIDLFMAELKPGRRGDEPEGGEAFGKTHYLTATELADSIRRGKIRDSYSIAALMFAQLRGFVLPPRTRRK